MDSQTITIKKNFSKSDDMPDWCKGDFRLEELCKTDLAFRANAFRAVTPELKNVLRREAEARLP